MSAGTARMHLISMRRGAAPAGEGRAELGGKAQGLLAASEALSSLDAGDFGGISIDIPPMTVLGTSVFEAFVSRNGLERYADSKRPDDRIAAAFQRANLPFEVLGELRALVNRWTGPLAVRSSGLLEDTMQRPFAGVYATKMIPNNAYDADTRFQKLVEAVKYVWASTYFKIARDYCLATGLDMRGEKMAVIIQQVVGKRYGERYYPELSGVARSINFYPFPPARPADGVVSLALGMGKTIVDGGRTWTYSPAYPHTPPPFGSVDELLHQTQTEFWAVNLGEPPEYNPLKESEYMRLESLAAAEYDRTLTYLASTYDAQSDRLTPGVGARGARALTFAPLLDLEQAPVNRLVRTLLEKMEGHYGCPVEIEFAMTFEPARLGFLQVRPMAAPRGGLELAQEDLAHPRAIAASEMALGNGVLEGIEHVVYVIPERFELRHTRAAAAELEQVNRALLAEGAPYLLVVFGRLGTLDPWLGIPVTWGQISGAKVIVEAGKENARVEPSQGSHYFHNIINLGVLYFSMPYAGRHRLDWEWLLAQPVVREGQFVRVARTREALRVVVDGQHGRGVIYRPS